MSFKLTIQDTSIVQTYEDVDDPERPFSEEKSSDSMPFPSANGTSGSWGPSRGDSTLIESFRSARANEKEKSSKHFERTQRAWDFYRNRYPENYGKEEWQSTKVAPTVFTTVEQFTATIFRMLEKSNDWLGMKSVTDKSAILLDFLRPLLHKMMTSEASQFGNVFRRAIKSMLLSTYSHVLVLYQNGETPSYNEPAPTSSSEGDLNLESLGFSFNNDRKEKPTVPGRNKPRLRYELINHDCVTMDSFSGGDIQNGGWKIMDQFFPVGYFKEKLAPSYGYDMEAVERGSDASSHSHWGELADMVDSPYVNEADRNDMLLDGLETNMVKVSHFFGTLYSREDGRILVDCQYFVVLNDTEIILQPEDIPFWEGEDPIVSSPLIEDPHNKTEGNSPIVMNLDMFLLDKELNNLLEDFYVSNLLGMREIDLDVLDDFESNFREGVFPGMSVYCRKRNHPNAQAIRNVPMTETDPGFWNYLGNFQRNMSMGTMLPDATTGVRPRGRTSDMENSRRAAESGSSLDMVWQALDENFLSKLGRKSMYRMLQYVSAEQWEDSVKKWADSFLDDARWEALSPAQREWLGSIEEFSKWPPEVRWEKLAGEYEMNIRVFSSLGDRQRMIEGITYFIQTGSALPGFAEIVNIPEIFRYLARAFDWQPDRVLRTEALGPPGIKADYNPFDALRQPQGGAQGPPRQTQQPQQQMEEPTGHWFQGQANTLSHNPPFAPGQSAPPRQE